MKIKSKPVKRIDREYIITSSELKKAMKIKGDIQYINLEKGRSYDDILKGISADNDTWCIKTKEIIEGKDE